MAKVEYERNRESEEGNTTPPSKTFQFLFQHTKTTSHFSVLNGGHIKPNKTSKVVSKEIRKV